MKIPILATIALLALVGANDDEEEIGERRLDDRGWYPDKAPNPDECGWKVFDKNDDCYKYYYCKDAAGKYGDPIKGGKIDDEYCGISSSSSDSSSDSSSSSSDCKKWKKKYKKCKKKNSKKKVSMHTFSAPVIAIVAYMYNLTWLTLSLFSCIHNMLPFFTSQCKKKSYYKKYKKRC